jgi:AmpD protein
MRIDPDSGLIEKVRQVPSPNQRERPPGARIELVVVHGISLPPDRFGGPWIDRLFTNTLDPDAHPFFAEITHLRVSAHVLIRRDGSVTQYVPFHRRASHAGRSRWHGRDDVNDFSVGIELEGTDDTPYEDIQYRQLARLIRALAETYPDLDPDRSPDQVTGHADVAPGRKTDPGEAFDWQYLHRLLH